MRMGVNAAAFSLLVYLGAALAEIAGCFAFWSWLKLGKSVYWIIPGVLALALFAWLLTLIDAAAAGRAFAAYGGIYILASLFWMWFVERTPPDRWDLAGAVVCVVGAGLILLAPRQ